METQDNDGEASLRGDIVHVKFTLALPEGKWLTDFSVRYPDFVFSIFSMLPLDENLGNTLIKVQGNKIDQFIKEFTKLESPSFSHDVLFKGKDNFVLDVRMNEPLILNALQKQNIPIKYPVLIQKGKAVIELLSYREKVDSLLTGLENVQIFSSINQIGPYEPRRVLSPRQEEILQHLASNGYFDIPRKKSISSLAAELGISPSSLSQDIRRIFRNLASGHLSK